MGTGSGAYRDCIPFNSLAIAQRRMSGKIGGATKVLRSRVAEKREHMAEKAPAAATAATGPVDHVDVLEVRAAAFPLSRHPPLLSPP